MVKLSLLRTAYVQVEAVANMKNKIQQAEEPFQYYEDYRLWHILDICNNVSSLEYVMHPEICKLYVSNYKRDAERLHVLRIYLKNNCKLTETANQLHMHRNTVLYHIHKIKEQYGIDMDHYKERLDVMLSLEIIEYLNGTDQKM